MRAASTPQSAGEPYLRIDAGVLAATSSAAEARLAELRGAYRSCHAERRGLDAAESCLRTVVFGDALGVVRESAAIRDSTLTGLLLDQRGSCAALVALALSLDPSAWDAFVLKEHVALRTRDDPQRFLEMTDGAREISVRELRSRFGAQVDRAVLVPASRFPVYYRDNLAVRLAAEGRDAEAERLFREAIAIGPKEARPRLNFGTFLLERGRLDEAEKHLRVAARRAPTEPDAWTNLGVAYGKLGKRNRAVDCFERALELDPKHQTARRDLDALRAGTAERGTARP